MRRTRILPLLLCLGASVVAQDKGVVTKYENPDLALVFEGVYGWKRRVAEGSGAWTELARYREDAFDADVVLFVRDNPYQTAAELRKALKEEFKEGGDPEPDKSVFKEVQVRDAAMRRGLGLPAVELEGFVVRVTKDGKKREQAFLSRTYLGKNRLFRVHCTVRRSRLKRVKDLFQRAVANIQVNSQEEKVVTGLVFRSDRGKYQCIVPAGFTAVLPPANSRADMRFGSRAQGVAVSVWAFPFDGILADHVEEMIDYYGDALKMENEEGKALGGSAFTCTVTKGERVTLVVGTVQKGRVFRIHTAGKKGDLDELKRVHAEIQKTFKVIAR